MNPIITAEIAADRQADLRAVAETYHRARAARPVTPTVSSGQQITRRWVRRFRPATAR